MEVSDNFSEYYGKLGSNGSREDDLTMLFSVPSQTIRLGLCSFAVDGCGFASGWLLEYLLGSLSLAAVVLGTCYKTT